MGAARKKGKWIGGVPPLGYDADLKNHKLVVNEQEAKLIKKIYTMYLEIDSILNTTIALNEEGYAYKKYISRTGRVVGGKKFEKNTIHRILMNPIYVGKVKYHGVLYNGEHEAIVTPELFEKVQERIRYNRVDRKVRNNAKGFGLLSQVLHCKACGCVMIHTYTYKKKVIKYRYYVCIKAQKLGYATCPTRSINAKDMEDAVMKHLTQIDLKDDPQLSDKYKAVIPKILSIWDSLVPNEKRRIIKQLFTSIDYTAEIDSLGYDMNEKGIYSLYGELCGQNSK